MTRLVLAAALAASLLGLTSCGEDARPAVSYEVSYEGSYEPLGSTGLLDLPDLPGLPSFTVGPTGISTDVDTQQCPTEQGAATASGSATNTGKFQRDVVVVVTWVDLRSRVPVARATTELADLAPAESRDWTAAADLDRPGLACTVAAYAGQLG